MRIKYTTLVFAVVMTSIILYSCKQSPSIGPIIEKRWAIDTAYGKAIDKQMAKIHEMLDTIKDSSAKAKLKEVVSNTLKDQYKETIQFNKDSTLDEAVTVMEQPFVLHGKWKLSDDNTKVVLYVMPQKDTIKEKMANGGEVFSVITLGANQQADTFNVNYCNANKMILKGKDESVWNGTIVLKPTK
jgi:hypothetical protein